MFDQILYHVSENGGIARFDLRPASNPIPGLDAPIVWAVDDAHLTNYLVPRDSPRIAIRAGAATTAADRGRFGLGGRVSSALYLEENWSRRIETARLFLYSFPSRNFRLVDAIAGYYISTAPVTPDGVSEWRDPLLTIRRRGVDIRFVEELWTTRDAVLASTLEFSMIRLRNARPKSAAATPASSPASR